MGMLNWVLVGIAGGMGLALYVRWRARRRPWPTRGWAALILGIATLAGVLLLLGGAVHALPPPLQAWSRWQQRMHAMRFMQVLAWAGLVGAVGCAGRTALLGYRVRAVLSRGDHWIAGAILGVLFILLVLKIVFQAVLPVLLGSGLMVLSLVGIRGQLQARHKGDSHTR